MKLDGAAFPAGKSDAAWAKNRNACGLLVYPRLLRGDGHVSARRERPLPSLAAIQVDDCLNQRSFVGSLNRNIALARAGLTNEFACPALGEGKALHDHGHRRSAPCRI